MKILKLHHPTGHPYWQADEYKIEMPDGCYVPFSFGQKHRTLLITIFSALMLLYVNLGLPYRVIYREERYCYIYWFA
jgi:hypothetical protein